MEKIVLGISEVLTAFNESDVVGTKVVGIGSFIHLLEEAIIVDGGKTFENENPAYAGSGFLNLPSDAFSAVRCGVALREGLTSSEKHIKEHRGDDEVFALPRCAAPIEKLSSLVYTIDKYFRDPEVKGRPAECAALLEAKATHVVVAVHAGPGSFSSHRLVENIAGGNLDFRSSCIAADAGLLSSTKRDSFGITMKTLEPLTSLNWSIVLANSPCKALR